MAQPISFRTYFLFLFLFPSQLQHQRHLWFPWSSNVFLYNIQIQTSCPHTNHPQEESKSILKVSRTKGFCSPKVQKVQCVSLILMELCIHSWANYYDMLTELNKPRLTLKHMAENGQGWFSQTVIRRKNDWCTEETMDVHRSESSLLSCMLPEPSYSKSSLNILSRFCDFKWNDIWQTNFIVGLLT